jgi:hypothetical protein
VATVAVLSWLAATVPSALADRPFTPRFSTDVTGNITFAANTLMDLSGVGCGVYRREEYAAGREWKQRGSRQQRVRHAVRQRGARDGSRAGGGMSRIRVVRLVVGDLVAAFDGDRSVRRALLGG